MDNLKKRNTSIEFLLSLGYDAVGSALLAVGIICFTAPNQIAPGGVTGLATIINYIFGWRIGMVSLLMNIPLLLIGYKFLGKRFSLSTLRTLVVVTLFMDVILKDVPVYTGDPLLAALFGGVFMGLGLGVVFMRGSTTGGSDIIVRLIQQKFPHMALGSIIFVTDLMVLVTAAFVYQNIETALYGLIAIFVCAKVIDAIIYGFDMGKCAIIISSKAQEIGRQINVGLNRSATILPAKGAYSGKDTNALICVVRKQEFFKLKTIVHTADPFAFVIVAEAGEILGEGFKPIKPEL